MSHSGNSQHGCTSVVAAVVEDAAGRILLCQQSQGHRLWALPGGRIRSAESPVHAVIRDIFEETGARPDLVDVVGLYQLTGDTCGQHLPDLLVHVFRGRLDGGEIIVNAPGRISHAAWFDAEALPETMTASTRTAISDARAGRSGVLRELRRDAEPDVPEASDANSGAAATPGALAPVGL
jgi:ADP-ribose pyrophosphatase YjhB (NUDIX family)